MVDVIGEIANILDSRWIPYERWGNQSVKRITISHKIRRINARLLLSDVYFYCGTDTVYIDYREKAYKSDLKMIEIKAFGKSIRVLTKNEIKVREDKEDIVIDLGEIGIIRLTLDKGGVL